MSREWDMAEAILDALYASGWFFSLRRGPCGQWKCRLTHKADGRQIDEMGATGPEAVSAAARKV